MEKVNCYWVLIACERSGQPHRLKRSSLHENGYMNHGYLEEVEFNIDFLKYINNPDIDEWKKQYIWVKPSKIGIEYLNQYRKSCKLHQKEKEAIKQEKIKIVIDKLEKLCAENNLHVYDVIDSYSSFT